MRRLRHRPSEPEAPVIITGDIEIDLSSHWVLKAGRDVRVACKEFDLLALLVRNAGTVLTHRQPLTAIWATCTKPTQSI